MNSIEELQAKVEAFEVQKAQVFDDIKDNFFNIIRPLFLEYPQLITLNWEQYAPYFNDGDACEFGLGDYNLNGYNEYSDKEPEPFGHVNIFLLGKKELVDYKNGKRVVTLNDNFQVWAEELIFKLNAIFNTIPTEVFENMFGNDKKITITAQGIEVEDYSDHD